MHSFKLHSLSLKVVRTATSIDQAEESGGRAYLISMAWQIDLALAWVQVPHLPKGSDSQSTIESMINSPP
jgi:hypothetical protein